MLLSISCWFLMPLFKGHLSLKLILILAPIIFLLPAIPFLFINFRKQRKQKLINQLNENVNQLNYSGRLLFKENKNLNTIEKLQLNRSINCIQQNVDAIKLKNNLSPVSIFFVLNFFTVLFLSSFQNQNLKSITTTILNQQTVQPQQNNLILKDDTLKLVEFNVYIKPPSYTKQKSYTQKKMNITALEGSEITWVYKFNKPVSSLMFNLNNTNSPFNTTDDIRFSKTLNIKTNSIYTIVLNDSIETVYLNALGEIKLIKDEAPIIKVSGIKAYEEMDISKVKPVNFKYELNDDYGIKEAAIHLILSSGSGEGVKFKEENIQLAGIKNNTSYTKNIDIQNYETQPGDEFYLRIRATDNKPFNPNTSYSSTYIIAIKDTTKTVATFEMALGMDIEPEHFRSQRQLIIDTENLLEEKPGLTNLAFKEQSNNIGIDQKLLRLRYGKFLGEEFEGEIGVRKDENVTVIENKNLKEEVDLHTHDENCEHDHHNNHHNQEVEKIDDEEHLHNENCDHHHNEVDHNHTHNEEGKDDNKIREDHSEHSHDHHGHHHNHSTNGTDNPDQEENLLAPFMHFHDSGEINTFFESEVKSKLKAALAQMWKSELQLRIGEPKASLPYQHKALKLIKEVQQASRVYVERVGMKMPEIPIAKKRLTGDLEEVEDLNNNQNLKNQDDYTALKKAISAFNKIDFTFKLVGNDKVINQLMQQLYLSSKLNPLKYASAINLTQQLANNRPAKRIDYLKLKQHLNKLLTSIEGEQTGKKVTQNTRLTNLYQQYLQN